MRDKDQILLEQAYTNVYNPINESVRRSVQDYMRKHKDRRAGKSVRSAADGAMKGIKNSERLNYIDNIVFTYAGKDLDWYMNKLFEDPRFEDKKLTPYELSRLKRAMNENDSVELNESVSRRSVQDIVFNKRSDVTEQDLRQAIFAALDRDKSISNAYGESPIYIQDIELNGDEVKIPLEQPITSNDANYFIIRVHDALEHQYDPDQGQLVDTINPSAIDEAARCTKVTKKASSDRKDKKYMKCVKSGKGYKRIHWGDPNAKVTGKSGNTKRKKSFRARHKCSTAKPGTPKYYACKDW